MSERKMPKSLHLGEHRQSPMLSPIFNWREKETPNKFGYREVMGYFLPPWQRGDVWTEAQQIRLIESVWRGLSIGTYTFNRSEEFRGPLDNLLIDGQQRMRAIQAYLSGAFPVFGYRWSEISKAERLEFELSRNFPCYITKSDDENYLRSYYDMMNFGGVAHKESDRAMRPEIAAQAEAGE